MNELNLPIEAESETPSEAKLTPVPVVRRPQNQSTVIRLTAIVAQTLSWCKSLLRPFGLLVFKEREDLELSTRTKAEESNASVSALSAAPAPAIANSPYWLVGMKRSIGASLDFTCVVLMALAPWFFEIISRRNNPPNLIVFVRTDAVLVFTLCLVMSPLSLIYLRIVFHRIMHSPTPGEMFSGFISSTTSNGLNGLMQESIYGLAQYFVISITGGQAILLVTIVLFMGAETSSFVQNNFLWLAATAIVSLCLMSTVYWPRSNTDCRSFIDDQCGVIVQRLR